LFGIRRLTGAKWVGRAQPSEEIVVVRRRVGHAFRVAVVAACLGLTGTASYGPQPVSSLSLPETAETGPLPRHRVDSPESGRYRTETSGACADPAATWLGTRWQTPMRWQFNPQSTPAYLGASSVVQAVAERAAGNVTAMTNPCGLAGPLRVTQRYDGETARTAAVRPDGACASRDGVNEVSFGNLAPGLLAVTCLWGRPGRHGRDGGTVEADIAISGRPGMFFVSEPADCGSSWDLEGTLTHEFSHAFGLGHVTAADHPYLTMSDELAPCDVLHRGLGLGDYDMLWAHYNGTARR
jgi:hypothetical protein